MPIYAYKCDACGHAKDVLQKMSDAPLTDCPACGAPKFSKQLTAPGFQLKGTGWYATDFKGGGAAGVPAAATVATDAVASSPANAPTSSPAAESASPGASPSTAASAGACAASCACH
jgi:putative FmdB family regulatory protein